jgi:alpha-L-glutamate ligase-like protein
MKISSILGLNARTQLFSYPYNTRIGKKTADSKLLSYRILKHEGIPTPAVFKKFKVPGEIATFNWESIPSSFALKPSRGLGGEGIIVVKKRALRLAQGKQESAWITTQRDKVTVADLKLHALDILEGAYSMSNIPDVAFIQEYVGRHKAFRKYSYRGTPDIRVIVFNKVPVMAMLRLPTRESGGRANLHQGALGVGIDMATGITTKAIWHGNPIRYKPETKRKLHGIKIPSWTLCLETAVRAQMVSGLGYLGVDIVLHPEKGPMVLELNAQPGLQIQLANMEGLRKRLERVEDLEVVDAEHGVRIAKALFAGRFADRVGAEEGIKILNPIEKVKVYSFDNSRNIFLNARIDTGALRSSIDRQIAKDLGLLCDQNILWKDRYTYRSSIGTETRPIIGIKLRIAGRKIKTAVSVTDRSKMAVPILIGRNDLSGFLVRASQ